MEWIKKIKNTFLKETKINDEIVVNELKELEKSYRKRRTNRGTRNIYCCGTTNIR